MAQTMPPDVAWRQRIVRRYFMDSFPDSGYLTQSAGSSVTYSSNGASMDTGAGVSKSCGFVELNHPWHSFFSTTQEVMAFFHSNTFTNAAGGQGVGIRMGGSTSAGDDTGESVPLDYAALKYVSATGKWQFHFYVGGGDPTSKTDCTVQPGEPAGKWARLAMVAHSTGEPDITCAKTFRCYVGNPPVLIHTYKAAIGFGGYGADHGCGIFAISGTNAAGRVQCRFSNLIAVSHELTPGS